MLHICEAVLSFCIICLPISTTWVYFFMTLYGSGLSYGQDTIMFLWVQKLLLLFFFPLCRTRPHGLFSPLPKTQGSPLAGATGYWIGLGGRLWLSGHSHFEFSPFGGLPCELYLWWASWLWLFTWNCPCGDAMGLIYSPPRPQLRLLGKFLHIIESIWW